MLSLLPTRPLFVPTKEMEEELEFSQPVEGGAVSQKAQPSKLAWILSMPFQTVDRLADAEIFADCWDADPFRLEHHHTTSTTSTASTASTGSGNSSSFERHWFCPLIQNTSATTTTNIVASPHSRSPPWCLRLLQHVSEHPETLNQWLKYSTLVYMPNVHKWNLSGDLEYLALRRLKVLIPALHMDTVGFWLSKLELLSSSAMTTTAATHPFHPYLACLRQWLQGLFRQGSTGGSSTTAHPQVAEDKLAHAWDESRLLWIQVHRFGHFQAFPASTRMHGSVMELILPLVQPLFKEQSDLRGFCDAFHQYLSAWQDCHWQHDTSFWHDPYASSHVTMETYVRFRLASVLTHMSCFNRSRLFSLSGHELAELYGKIVMEPACMAHMCMAQMMMTTLEWVFLSLFLGVSVRLFSMHAHDFSIYPLWTVANTFVRGQFPESNVVSRCQQSKLVLPMLSILILRNTAKTTKKPPLLVIVFFLLGGALGKPHLPPTNRKMESTNLLVAWLDKLVTVETPASDIYATKRARRRKSKTAALLSLLFLLAIGLYVVVIVLEFPLGNTDASIYTFIGAFPVFAFMVFAALYQK